MGSLLYDVKPNNIPTLVEVAITLRVAALRMYSRPLSCAAGNRGDRPGGLSYLSSAAAA
jgi:hypothetical protein